MIQTRRVSALFCLASALSMAVNADLFDGDLFAGVNKIGKGVGMMQGLFKGFTSNKMVMGPIKYSECPKYKDHDFGNSLYINYDTVGGDYSRTTRMIEKDEEQVISVEA